MACLANSAFGIDLGTGNIKIYNRADNSILNEKNMIAIENKNVLFAYGDDAFEMDSCMRRRQAIFTLPIQ